jgi:transposase
LPGHLPRERVVVPAPLSCPCCGGKLVKLGESITETLESVPRQWKVVQTVREKFACRACETITQPPAPFHPIARGRAGPNLLAMILDAKFAQHQPLNRQSEVYAREGIELDVSTLADWVGACSAALAPLLVLIRAHVMAAERLHGDDTIVPVLAKGKTITGRLWTYVRDDAPFAGTAAPAALFFYSRDRSAEHPNRHLAGYAGILQADAYAGFNDLYHPLRPPGPVTEAACWAHGRRKFFKLAEITRAPLAVEAVRRIDAIFDLERAISGKPAAERLAVRRRLIAPLVGELETWMRAARAKLSRHNDVAKAMDYMLKRWKTFTRVLDDSRICLTTDGVEKPQTSSSSRFFWLVLPSCHHLLIGPLSPFDIVHLLVPDFPNPVVAAWARFSIFSRRSRLECQLAELHRGERRSGKRVFGLSRQHVPDHDRQFAGRRYSRRGSAALFLNPNEKRTERAGRRFRRPSRLHEHLPGVAVSLLGDAPVAGRLVTGLAHLGCEPKVAAQLLRRRKARHLTDGSQYGACHDRAYAGDRHQLPSTRVVERLLCQDLIEVRHLGGNALKFSHQAPKHGALLARQRKAIEPSASSLAEEMPGVFRNQVRMQDCLDAPFQSDHLLENPHPLGDLASTVKGILVGDPHGRQEACPVQASENSGIDFVRLDSGVGNRPHQA